MRKRSSPVSAIDLSVSNVSVDTRRRHVATQGLARSMAIPRHAHAARACCANPCADHASKAARAAVFYLALRPVLRFRFLIPHRHRLRTGTKLQSGAPSLRVQAQQNVAALTRSMSSPGPQRECTTTHFRHLNRPEVAAVKGCWDVRIQQKQLIACELATLKPACQRSPVAIGT